MVCADVILCGQGRPQLAGFRVGVDVGVGHARQGLPDLWGRSVGVFIGVQLYDLVWCPP